MTSRQEPSWRPKKTCSPEWKGESSTTVFSSPSELLPVGYLPEPEWAAALATAYNQYMVDAYQDLGGVKIAIVVAPQHPVRAAEEIDRHAAHPDVVSVCIPDVGVNPPIGDEKYWPIFAAAARHDLPISFHGIEALIHDNYPLRVAHFHTLMQVNSMGVSLHFNAADHVGRLCRHPRPLSQPEICHS